MPAIVAEIKEAKVPPKRAFIPNSDSVLRCPSAKDLVPQFEDNRGEKCFKQ
ncbi:hypothetical protein ACFSQP_09205 [Bizionia sediminis]|uniref:Uncharacterized protein n=1 Tax=Bizionia sediminis TaxID=1737064 RepID=A0ABW5KSW1_9FLAO